MQIGIDVGATKIESVVLENDGQESHRSRIVCPKDYLSIIKTIKEINEKLDKEFKNQTPWQEISRKMVGQLETGACLETESLYLDITNTKGMPRHSH